MNGGRGIEKGCLLVFFVKGARTAIVYVLTVLETQNLGCDFFRPMPFTKDGVRLRTIFFSAKMTIRALFSPKNTILLCRYADTHTK
jgi:hypothetical protein